MALRNGAIWRPVPQPAAPEDEGWSGEAFDVLYRRYWPRLVAMCRRRVGDEALAEDIAQETLLRALMHMEQLDGDRPLWPWLKTTATNLAIDHARKHARLVSADNHEDHPTEAAPSVEDTDLLRRAIKSLPGRQRTAVALRYINDWDATDAANFLGVSRPAYEQLLFRGRRRLQAEYRRLAGEVFGGAVAGASALRRALRRASAGLRKASADLLPFGELTSLSASQLAGGALALAVTLGPQPGLAHPPVAAPRMRVVADVSAERPNHSARGVVHERRARGLGADGTAGVAGAGEGPQERDHAVAYRGGRDLGTQLTGSDVDQPEDAHITSIAISSDFQQDGTLFAAGRADCPQSLCPSALFESTDGGSSWSRMTATAFDGEDVLLPPAFGKSDRRIFATGRSGLQVSNDGGETFVPAVTTGASFAAGAAAISPAFEEGDPSILIGNQTLMRYRDDTKNVEPVPSNLWTGPLYPAYAPDYPVDQRIVVGGLGLDQRTGSMVSAVYTCSGTLCDTTILDTTALPATVRLSPDFARSNLEYAFTATAIYVSEDGGATFERLVEFDSGTFVHDLNIGPNGRLFVAAKGTDAGLYMSRDGGSTWTRSTSPLFEYGAARVVSVRNRVIAARGSYGLACSTDAGRSWTRRC